MANLLPERDLSEFTYVCVPIWRSQVVTSVGFSTSFNVFDYFTSRRYWELNKEKKKSPLQIAVFGELAPHNNSNNHKLIAGMLDVTSNRSIGVPSQNSLSLLATDPTRGIRRNPRFQRGCNGIFSRSLNPHPFAFWTRVHYLLTPPAGTASHLPPPLPHRPPPKRREETSMSSPHPET